ncbi:MAG: hypothetical protein OEY06_01615 [Gammaproteobacteria bacterium]|nr:hypothetical protein [Gammaproteobacteria bacterium]
MGRVNKSYLRAGVILLVVNSAVCAPSINAAEWRGQDNIKSKLGFSDFIPPPGTDKYQNRNREKQWASGSSFNEENKVRYSPVSSKNPWKVVKSVNYKKNFASQRPWGNVPDRKPKNKNSMKFYDQRFKQWSHQQSSSQRNNAYGQLGLPFSGGDLIPGYNNPLITPPIYSGYGGYGLYPRGLGPYSGALSRPGLW